MRALSPLRGHRSRNVIGHMTIRLSIDDFLHILNRNQTRMSLSFHDVITGAITPRWTIIPVEPIDTDIETISLS